MKQAPANDSSVKVISSCDIINLKKIVAKSYLAYYSFLGDGAQALSLHLQKATGSQKDA